MLLRLRTLKHVVGGLIALPLLFSGVEVGMRIYSACHGSCELEAAPRNPLLVDSALTFQALKPLQKIQWEQPSFAESVEIETNSFGIRGPEPSVPKPAGIFRILCLGDESVAGFETTYADLWTSRLQQYLQRRSEFQIEVINAGIPGYCPLLSYLQYKHTLSSLQPDLVILSFQMNDVADDHRYRRFTRLDERGLPIACSSPSEMLNDSEWWKQLSRDLKTANWCAATFGRLLNRQEAIEGDLEQDLNSSRWTYRWLESIPAEWEFSVQQSLEPIGQLEKLTHGTSTSFLLAIVPAPWQVSADASNGSGVRAQFGVGESSHLTSREPFERILNYAESHHIQAIEPSTAFLNFDRADRLFLKPIPLFSRIGHALFARELAYHVVDHVSGPWIRHSTDVMPVPLSQREKPRQ
ncbi:MAG: SGNH/GDSL hydrolase family protein [Planctomycetota bacterium]|nr:SGNH/GDSL hydrolase family protein [Planctomycetota bacterium]MDA1214150.1 SGNH/GDSL hydrolase family protein [Planctomycetota bacterium]